MKRMTLKFHDHRKLKPSDENEMTLLLLFSLTSEGEQRPGNDELFWTEASLSGDLAARGRWSGLPVAEKQKALFRHTVEAIQAAGRKLRQTRLCWFAGNPTSLEDGPPWNLAEVQFPKPHAIPFELEEEALAAPLGAREGAGLNK
jgi:hypothetical protein